MASCAFFGHRCFSYLPYREQVKSIVVDLIENHGVTTFYTGGRGDFDSVCADIVSEQKKRFSDLRLILVLSYHPTSNFYMSDHYNDSVYLLEQYVPPKYAISRTNRRLVELVDYIVSGVYSSFGGAYDACCYAKRLNKPVFEISFK